MARVTRHRGRWTMADQVALAWQYLPVEIPPGACGLRVELAYDRSAAVLDLGCLGAAGFRGWSGGARQSFVITSGAATPGYLAGELEPGRWQVVLGLYQVPPGGVTYQLTAEISSRPGELAPAPEPAPPPPPPGRRGQHPGRAAVAGRRPAHPHRALGWGADGRRARSLCSQPGA